MKSFIKNRISGVIAFVILFVILSVLVIIHTKGNPFSNILYSLCLYTREYIGIACVLCFLVLLFLAFSKYGKIRLGGDNAKKEYSTFSWISCLFMAGCGIGIVFYNQESVFHYHNNPYFEKLGGDPSYVAYSLTLFDWTINAWSLFGMLGLIIAYFHFNKKRTLKISSILPEQTNICIKRTIDIIMALGVIAGLTTSLGLGIVQLKSGLNYVFDYDVNTYLLIFIIGMIASWSVTSGLQKGVKWLSNINTYLVCALLIILVLITHNSISIGDYLKYIGGGVGTFIKNSIDYNNVFDTNADEWAANWAVFYQYWFAAWSAFVAVFIAKISKGRTVREFIIGVVLFPTVFTILWFGIFGRIGIDYQDMLYKEINNDITKSLFIFLSSFTTQQLYFFLSIIILIILCLFFITSADSGAYVVASLLSENPEVSSREKIFWSTLQCLTAMILFYCGGLALIQSASVIMGILVVSIILIGIIFFIKEIRREN